jgi:hypothetical protein
MAHIESEDQVTSDTDSRVPLLEISSIYSSMGTVNGSGGPRTRSTLMTSSVPRIQATRMSRNRFSSTYMTNDGKSSDGRSIDSWQGSRLSIDKKPRG